MQGGKCTVMVCIKLTYCVLTQRLGWYQDRKQHGMRTISALETQWIYMNLLIKSKKSIYDMINQYSYTQLLRQARNELSVFPWKMPKAGSFLKMVLSSHQNSSQCSCDWCATFTCWSWGQTCLKKLIGSHQTKANGRMAQYPGKIHTIWLFNIAIL